MHRGKDETGQSSHFMNPESFSVGTFTVCTYFCAHIGEWLRLSVLNKATEKAKIITTSVLTQAKLLCWMRLVSPTTLRSTLILKLHFEK